MNVARTRKEHNPHLRWTRSTRPRRNRSSLLRVSSSSFPGEPPGALVAMARRLEVRGRRLGVSFATTPRRSRHRRVARHEQHPLAGPVLGGEPFEQGVRVWRVAHLERAALASSPTPSKTTIPRAPCIAT